MCVAAVDLLAPQMRKCSAEFFPLTRINNLHNLVLIGSWNLRIACFPVASDAWKKSRKFIWDTKKDLKYTVSTEIIRQARLLYDQLLLPRPQMQHILLLFIFSILHFSICLFPQGVLDVYMWTIRVQFCIGCQWLKCSQSASPFLFIESRKNAIGHSKQMHFFSLAVPSYPMKWIHFISASHPLDARIFTHGSLLN